MGGGGGGGVRKFGMGGRVGLGGRRPDPGLLVPDASRQEAEANLKAQAQPAKVLAFVGLVSFGFSLASFLGELVLPGALFLFTFRAYILGLHVLACCRFPGVTGARYSHNTQASKYLIQVFGVEGLYFLGVGRGAWGLSRLAFAVRGTALIPNLGVDLNKFSISVGPTWRFMVLY